MFAAYLNSTVVVFFQSASNKTEPGKVCFCVQEDECGRKVDDFECRIGQIKTAS